MGLPSTPPPTTTSVATHQTPHPKSHHPLPQQTTQGWGRLSADGKRARLPKQPTPHHHLRSATRDADDQSDHRKHLHLLRFITAVAPALRSNGCTSATASPQPISITPHLLNPTIPSNRNISRLTLSTSLHPEYRPSWILPSLISAPPPCASITPSTS